MSVLSLSDLQINMCILIFQCDCVTKQPILILCSNNNLLIHRSITFISVECIT